MLIEQAEVLRELYGRIIIPQAVFEELQRRSTPEAVRRWVAAHPEWLEVQQANHPLDVALEALDAGEREAIALTKQLRADALIMDARDGRREAIRRNLPVIGTPGALDEAAERGLIDLPKTIERLQQTSFRASPRLLKALLDRHQKHH